MIDTLILMRQLALILFSVFVLMAVLVMYLDERRETKQRIKKFVIAERYCTDLLDRYKERIENLRKDCNYYGALTVDLKTKVAGLEGALETTRESLDHFVQAYRAECQENTELRNVIMDGEEVEVDLLKVKEMKAPKPRRKRPKR